MALLSLCTAAAGRAVPDETLLAEQSDRVQAAVATLAPQTPGTIDVFFVGFAGHGAQGVFRKEATYARTVLGERYGSSRRAVLLVNDEKDRESLPLATVTNLRLALRLVAARMNREEDILILFLTSHGDPQAGLDVSNGRLPLKSLEPAALKSALDEAGIRWRIVIASACYAGVFVKPLRSDESLVMTAADARHSSFGCEDDRELTYFGEALLRDALPAARSLEEAFEKARRIIYERERNEDLEHSRPQIAIGPRMRERLAGLEANASQLR